VLLFCCALAQDYHQHEVPPLPPPRGVAFTVGSGVLHRHPVDADTERATQLELAAISQIAARFQTPSSPCWTELGDSTAGSSLHAAPSSDNPPLATASIPTTPGTLQKMRSLFEGNAAMSPRGNLQPYTPRAPDTSRPLALGNNAHLSSAAAGPVGKPRADVSFSRRSTPPDSKKKSAKRGKKKDPGPDMDAARLYAERILDMSCIDPDAKQDYTLMSLVDGQTTIHMAKDVKIESQFVRQVAGGHTALSPQLAAVALSGEPFLLT
jgi:hypothetical protein